MKKTLLSLSLCMLVGASFAQKKALKDAKSEMNSNNFNEARALLKPAFTDSETSLDPETWKIAGDIENKQFDTERTKAMLQKSPDSIAMYTALYASIQPYMTADSLGLIPDEKGKVKKKYRKDIASIMRANQPAFAEAGIYYYNKRDYLNASRFFEQYWNIPTLSCFDDDKEKIQINDPQFKYYAVIFGIQAASDAEGSQKDQLNKRSISLLKKLINETYVENETYKEQDPYELLVSQYQVMGDTVNFTEALELSAKKFPNNKFFTQNLINEYIKAGDTDRALAYLDKAIEDAPEAACDLYSVKAALYSEKKDHTTADKTYQTALTKDSNCERALEGLAVSYIVQAQDLKEQAGNVSVQKDRVALDDQAKALYEKAAPLLEKFKSLLVERQADDRDLKGAYVKLQNVYYNLDDEAKYEDATKILESYTNAY